MNVYTYPQLLTLMDAVNGVKGLKMTMENTISAWYLKTECAGHPFISMIYRFNIDKKDKVISSGAWPPNTHDMIKGQFVVKEGEAPPPEDVRFIPGSSGWAAEQVINQHKTVRRQDWKPGQRITRFADKIYMVLPNGKELDNEFHFDFFDIAFKWETFN